MVITDAIIGQGIGLGKELAGPVISTSLSDFRQALGWTDAARARKLLYNQNYHSTIRDPSDNFTPFRLNAEQAIRVFNQAHWSPADTNPVLAENLWARLQSNLKFMGIATSTPSEVGNVDPAYRAAQVAANEWRTLIEKSSSGPSLDAVIRNYYRSAVLPQADRTCTLQELYFQLSRAQFRRKQDRELVTRPFASWTLLDAARIKWRAGISNSEYSGLLHAAGAIRPEDERYAGYLNRVIPDLPTLFAWDASRLWDSTVVSRLSLDDAYNTSDVAAYFKACHGLDDQSLTFPDEPGGEKDWAKLAWRASRRLPDFAELRKMQYRLRPDPNVQGESIIPGAPPWTQATTITALEHAGIPKPIANQMVLSSAEPIPLHLLGVVLAPVLEQPTIRALAEQLYPNQEDWIKEALLDHGFTDEFSTLAEAAIRQDAQDKANAEMIASKKAIRHQARQTYLERYKIGLTPRPDAINLLTDPQYTNDMATDALDNIDREIDSSIANVKLASLKAAFMSGQANPQQIGAAMTTMQITRTRQAQYLDEWNWERNTDMKHQTTGEILQTMKAGLTTPAQTIQRLTNLGWRNPDAIAEVAIVQHEMTVTQAKQLAAAQAHQAAQLQHAASQAAHAAAQAKAAQAKVANIVAHMTRQQLLAVHAKLLAQAEYYAKVHAANDAYAQAEKKGDTEKMAEEIAKEVAAYQSYLQHQTTLLTENPGVKNVIGPLDTKQAPRPQAGAPAPATPASTTGSTPPPSGTTGGHNQSPGP